MGLQVINHQLPMKKESREDGTLDVFKVWNTIQGEGPFAGTPAVFVRLRGCNLQCKHCDTDYTSGFVEVEPRTLVNWVFGFRSSGLVVITGGEPFRQNIGPFIREMIQAGEFKVQIETNGTLYQDIPYVNTTVVCSPKTPGIHQDLVPRINALKYVLSADAVDPADGLPLHVLGDCRTPCKPWRAFKGDIYVQPEDTGDETKNKANTQAVVDSCMKFGYRVCLQTHKILGLE